MRLLLCSVLVCWLALSAHAIAAETLEDNVRQIHADSVNARRNVIKFITNDVAEVTTRSGDYILFDGGNGHLWLTPHKTFNRSKANEIARTKAGFDGAKGSVAGSLQITLGGVVLSVLEVNVKFDDRDPLNFVGTSSIDRGPQTVQNDDGSVTCCDPDSGKEAASIDYGAQYHLPADSNYVDVQWHENRGQTRVIMLLVDAIAKKTLYPISLSDNFDGDNRTLLERFSVPNYFLRHHMAMLFIAPSVTPVAVPLRSIVWAHYQIAKTTDTDDNDIKRLLKIEPDLPSVGRGCDSAAAIDHIVEPEYPDEAREASAVGTAIVEVDLDSQGKVTDSSVTTSTGNDALDDAALKAAQQTTYLPEIKACKGLSGHYQFRADFSGK